MAETVPGGIYKDATGDGFHDAFGKPVLMPTPPSAPKPAQPLTPTPRPTAVNDSANLVAETERRAKANQR